MSLDLVLPRLLDSSPYAVTAYLVFLLLTRALDRLNRKSRTNGGTGRHTDATRADAETGTDAEK